MHTQTHIQIHTHIHTHTHTYGYTMLLGSVMHKTFYLTSLDTKGEHKIIIIQKLYTAIASFMFKYM